MWTSEQAVQALTSLEETVEQVARAHFPASAGYKTRTTSLSGMLKGSRVLVSCDGFEAVVSAQHFTEPSASSPGAPRRHALRLVGSIRDSDRVSDRGLLAVVDGPGFVLLALATILMTLVYIAWAPGFWGICRLTLLMGFAIMMTPAVAWILGAPTRREELMASSAWRALPAAECHSEHRARWREFLQEVDVGDDIVLQSQNTLPFRR